MTFFVNNDHVQITNLTHPELTPAFETGDSFQITVTGAPNQPVYVSQSPDMTTTQMGQTDGTGKFVLSGVSPSVGIYTQVWSVGSVQATPAITFVVGQLGGGGTISTTGMGQTSDGSLSGLSYVSVGNGTVLTYSATQLSAEASLYYDTESVGTLYEDGTAIKQGIAQGYNIAATSLSAPAAPWKDYTLQTDHYAIAFIPVGGYFYNPFYLGDGSCDYASSDCSIGIGSGDYWIIAATIYVGSTLADQTNIPQDGSVPAFVDSVYDNFLASSQPPYPSGVVFKADVREWFKRLSTISVAIVLSERANNAAHGSASTKNDLMNNPIPFFVDLLPPPDGDEYRTNSYVIPPQGERARTYLLKDTLGHVWADRPVIVRERFSSKVGYGQLPPASAFWYYRNPVPQQFRATSQELFDHQEMTDHYGLSGLPPAEVGFVQYYYAEGFNPPPWLSVPTGFSLPGVTDQGLVMPLWIKDSYNKCAGATFAAGQPVRFNPSYTGIDGDLGPGQGCAPPTH